MTDLLEILEKRLGDGAILTGGDVTARPAHIAVPDGCAARAILRPRTTDEVAFILRTCNRRGQPVVPLGGNTGMAGGGIARPDEIVLSLERMTAIGDVDPVGRTMVAEAGTPLQKVHEAAEAHGLMFPLDLGARGSATIGGNIATNAGGNKVLRFGMTRDMVLGLEAVLADGTIVSSMNTVLKNNTGYDIKQLFIGSEGTLGVVTRAVLRLRPLHRSECTAILAVPDYASVLDLLRFLEAELAGTLSGFEVMWNSYYAVAAADKRQPLKPGTPYYVLTEALGASPERDQARFEAVLADAMEQGLVDDAAIARSKADRADMWAIRDNIEALLKWWPFCAFDISMPIAGIDSYVAETEAALADKWPSLRACVFGHLGDSNIHYILTVGEKTKDVERDIEEIVYRGVAERGGSISAEHGIGLVKKDFLSYSRSEAELALMAALKKTLDPNNILNPGKVLP